MGRRHREAVEAEEQDQGLTCSGEGGGRESSPSSFLALPKPPLKEGGGGGEVMETDTKSDQLGTG